MSENQLKLSQCVICKDCEFGRSLGADEYFCRNECLYQAGVIDERIHKSEFSCQHGREKEGI